MKYTDQKNEKKYAKWEASRTWRDWFAWFPVRTRDGNTLVWLETVKRKRNATGLWSYDLQGDKE